MIKIVSLIFFIFYLTYSSLYASSDDSIDNILNDIGTKTDLSEKTKLENGGISFIYTRNDLERMQAKNLNDVLKTTYPFGYDENRYGFSDSLTFGTDHPFLSSSIRVYIDNQEITTGYTGSGLFVIGDMDIDFVDHIEIYSLNPTYEYSTEPTFILVKLYSKVAQKDRGGKIRIRASSHNSSAINGYYSDELDEWSYFSYASYNKENKDKYRFDRYSKDREYINAFASIYNENNRILIQVLHQNRDGFISQYFDIDIHDDYFDSDYLHIGYDGNIGNFSFMATYDYFKFNQSYFSDNTTLLNTLDIPYAVTLNSTSNVITLGAKYKYIMEKDSFLVGLKYRYKDYRFLDFFVDGLDEDSDSIKHQTFSTIFLENQYNISENALLTASANYSRVKNSKNDDVDNLFLYRFGFTYITHSGFIFKTIFSHTKTLLDLIYTDSSHYLKEPNNIKPIESDVILENIIYEMEQDKIEATISYLRAKNVFVPDYTGKLYNAPDIIEGYGFSIRNIFRYRDNDKLFVELSYNTKKNLPNAKTSIKKRVVVRNLNSYGKFDIFNEIFYLRESKDRENTYDYSAGVIYHYSKDLSFSIKGQNIFNKAKATDFVLINPDTLQKDTVLEVPSIEQRFSISLEYLF